VIISKSFLPPSTSSGTIVQMSQNLAEEIDNYFKKYNDYKENKKIKCKNIKL
jgi:inorganic pyrophosphatase